MKCAEASWLLEIVFYGFSTCGCYLEHKFAILGVRNLLFYMPVASILHPGDNFVSLGTFEGTTEGHMGAQKRIFTDFE